MVARFTKSQRDKLREHFRPYVYYRLCRAVRTVFMKRCSVISLFEEDLFVDAVKTLDDFLINAEPKEDRSSDLWSEKLSELQNKNNDIEVTQAEVAMLFYAVMLGLQSVNNSYFRGKLQRQLRSSLETFWGRDNCISVELLLPQEINDLKDKMYQWMREYYTTPESLTSELQSFLRPAKKQMVKDKNNPYYTLPYNCKDETLRMKRIDFVRRKWEEWGWLQPNTDVDDFAHFFSGQERDCQLKWIASGAILKYLISQLLHMDDCFDHVTGCSTKAIVRNQFNQTYDSHKDRVDDLIKEKVEWTKKLLNYHVPLEFPKLPYNQGEDISDAALYEVFAGELHINKDLNKYNK